MIKAHLVLAATVLLNGCASVSPLLSSISATGSQPPIQAHTQTSVNLTRGNFVLVKANVVGQSKGFSLLGLITIVPANLTKALNRLYAAAAMQEGNPQTIAHLVLEHSCIYWILFAIPETTARADIVQFIPDPEPREAGDSRRREPPPVLPPRPARPGDD